MAQLALGVVGAVVGSFFGPLGASIGFALGSAVGSLIDPQKIQGPRLEDRKLHISSYSAMITIGYGRSRTAGNVIWCKSELNEHKNVTGGKGGPQVTTFTYGATFAVLLCDCEGDMGPIYDVLKIWSYGELIYDQAGAVTAPFPGTLYTGTQTQMPDPIMEGLDGVGNVPGYRGCAYMVFDDLAVGTNSIPSLEFLIDAKAPANVVITEVRANRVEPYNDISYPEWAYTFFGRVGNRSPYISQWPLAGPSPIKVGTVEYAVPQFNGKTYWHEPDTFNLYDEQDIEAGDDFPILVDPAIGIYYHPIGRYVYSNGVVEHLWVILGTNIPVSGPGLVNVSIASRDVYYAGPSPSLNFVAGWNFSFYSGITPGENVTATVLTEDGRSLFAFTAPDSGVGSLTTKWYEISDGLVIRSGTVIPNLSRNNPLGYGSSGASRSTIVCGAENNREWFWWYSSTIDEIQAYRIVAGNFARDVASGYARANFSTVPPGDVLLPGAVLLGTYYPAMYIPQDGYCGVALGRTMVLFSRIASANTLLWQIVQDQSLRVGYQVVELDTSALTDVVDGYKIANQSSARDNLLQLQTAFFFDAVESSGIIKFVKRGGAVVATIPDDDLAASSGEDDNDDALLQIERLHEEELPYYLDVSYTDASIDYQTNTQNAQRLITDSLLKSHIQLAVVMSNAKAAQVTWAILISAWVERIRFPRWSTSRKWAHLEPTDVISVRGYEIRITQKTEGADNVVRFEGVQSRASVWTQSVVPAPALGFTPSVPSSTDQDTDLLLLDIPFVADGDADTGDHGFYAAMAGSLDANWRGGILYKSSDGGASYQEIAASNSAATMGTAESVLGDFFGGNAFDEGNIVTVMIGNGGGTLAGATELAVHNGANMALIGFELIQFKNAVLIYPDIYELSGLLRGRRGTDWAMSSHVLGEHFGLIDAAVIDVSAPFAELGQARLYKAVTVGRALALATAQSFTNYGQKVRPYAPVQLGGGIDASGNATINWVRRTRLGGAWSDFVDVPLSEAVESYIVEIWDASYSQCARIITASTQTASYTAAQQASDFGATQLRIYFTVGQIGVYGLGSRARGNIAGAGGSSGLPITPIPPYNGQPVAPVPPTGANGTLVWAPTPPANSTLHDTVGFTIGQTYVVAFTTDATLVTNGTVSVTENNTPAVMRHLRLCTDVAGLNLISPLSEAYGTTAIVYIGTLGAGVYSTTLAISTTYYAVVRAELASGQPSGTLGANADMRFQLSHTP